MKIRVPTDEEYVTYNGAHCFHLWKQVTEDWRCPGCERTKRQLMRWTLRTPNGQRFWGWMAGLHRHHDHSQGYINVRQGRFPEQIICDQCNSADGMVKRHLRLPSGFSFSPEEIRQFVSATPHGKHRVYLDKAFEIYQSLERRIRHLI